MHTCYCQEIVFIICHLSTTLLGPPCVRGIFRVIFINKRLVKMVAVVQKRLFHKENFRHLKYSTTLHARPTCYVDGKTSASISWLDYRNCTNTCTWWCLTQRSRNPELWTHAGPRVQINEVPLCLMIALPMVSTWWWYSSNDITNCGCVLGEDKRP